MLKTFMDIGINEEDYIFATKMQHDIFLKNVDNTSIIVVNIKAPKIYLASSKVQTVTTSGSFYIRIYSSF